jgi:regulatory protein
LIAYFDRLYWLITLKDKEDEKDEEVKIDKVHKVHKVHKVDTENHATSDVPVLRRAAMDFLARREHSFHELQHKLHRKFPDSPAAQLDDVLQCLADEGLQSDDRFTESWVRYRQGRGFGYHHIRSDLCARGLSNTTIDRYLFDDDDAWLNSARDLVRKRLRSLNTEIIEFGSKPHRKLLKFLESRGFGHREIRQALEEVVK